MNPYRLVARNLAVESANKMHDDEVAQQYGFAGGLVPGADVFAYMAHLPVAAWGGQWLAAGTMSARFRHPVYDGEEIVISGTEQAAGLEVEVHNPAGELCAAGIAGLPSDGVVEPDAGDWPPVPLPAERHRAKPGVVAALARLGDWDAVVDSAKGRRYLDDIGEASTDYDGGAIAHPGWLVRCANRVLAANVALGPWIHTASELRNFAPVRHGQHLSTRARLASEYERKGHRFVELDVVLVADGYVAATIHHTAIYLPARLG